MVKPNVLSKGPGPRLISVYNYENDELILDYCDKPEYIIERTPWVDCEYTLVSIDWTDNTIDVIDDTIIESLEDNGDYQWMKETIDQDPITSMHID